MGRSFDELLEETRIARKNRVPPKWWEERYWAVARWFKEIILEGGWKRALRFWWQRQTRGFDDSETWGLDYTCCRWLLPRFKRYRELSEGFCHPCGTTADEWHNILDDIEYFLNVDAEYIEDDFDLDKGETIHIVDWDRFTKGEKLFGEYFRSLWW